MTGLHTLFGTTLRRLADTEPDTERARQMALLASQLEVAFDQQSSNVQVALWDVQEAAYKKIDDLHAHQGDTNQLLSGVIEAIGGLKQAVETSALESAARLGKLEEGQAALAGQVNTLTEEMGDSKADRKSLREAFDAYVRGSKRDKIDEIIERLAQLESRQGPDMSPEDREAAANDFFAILAWWRTENPKAARDGGG
jgi:chromosome segregation ATPase